MKIEFNTPFQWMKNSFSFWLIVFQFHNGKILFVVNILGFGFTISNQKNEG